MTSLDLPTWYRSRGYAHFDRLPHPSFAVPYVTSPTKVAAHPFWPFLEYIKKTKKYVRDLITKKRRRAASPKLRPIRYSAHLDGHIYARYSEDLGLRLSTRYQQAFGTSVLAYRKFTVSKCNVHFAVDAFEEIVTRGDCDVIGIDVEDFFGTLDHAHLKKMWCQLLGDSQLPEDHYAVFRAITKYSWVGLNAVRNALGRDVARRRRDWATRVCSPREFRQHIRSHVQVNSVPRGIPQGSPISAVLSNLYMVDTDEGLFQALISMGGTYRRYSDDLLVITPPGSGVAAESLLTSTLSGIGLKVQAAKTLRVAVRSVGGALSCRKLDELGQVLSVPAPIQYLGLLWDGKDVKLRAQTLGRFLSRMVSGVRGARAVASEASATKLRRRKLYRRFSRLGRSRRIFGDQPPSKKRNRNFTHYGFMAARIAKSEALRRQVGRQWPRLESEIAKAERDL